MRRRQIMRVKEVMTSEVAVIDADCMLYEAAARMKSLDIGPLPVCQNGRLVGMLTDRDITVRATAEGEDPKVIRVRDIMTPEVHYCCEDDLVSEAVLIMQEHQIRRLLVLNHDRELVGVVTLGDLAVQTQDDLLAGQTLEQVSEPAGRSP
jgi:CBS domain-containing protein